MTQESAGEYSACWQHAFFMFCPPKFEKLTMPSFKNSFFSASNKSVFDFSFPTYEKLGKAQALFKSYSFPRYCLEALASNQNTILQPTLNQSYPHYQEHFIGTITNTLPLIASWNHKYDYSINTILHQEQFIKGHSHMMLATQGGKAQNNLSDNGKRRV